MNKGQRFDAMVDIERSINQVKRLIDDANKQMKTLVSASKELLLAMRDDSPQTSLEEFGTVFDEKATKQAIIPDSAIDSTSVAKQNVRNIDFELEDIIKMLDE